MTAQLHLAVDALALQLLLERAQRLLDIIVANDDLHKKPVTLLKLSLALSGAYAGNTISAVRSKPRRRAAISRREQRLQPVSVGRCAAPRASVCVSSKRNRAR